MKALRLKAWVMIAVALAGAIVSAGLGYIAQRQDAMILERLSEDNSLWHAAALQRDVLRFTGAVGAAMIARPDLLPPSESVQFRFDILWSRVVTARSGEVGRRMKQADPDGTLDLLMELLETYEAQVAAFDPTDEVANAAMLARFGEVEERLGRVAHNTDRLEQERVEEIHEEMLGTAELTKAAGFCALFLCAAIAIAARRQTQIDSARLVEIRRQAQRAEEAARTRERFLTMVSHELRTPMNGVLGMINLLEETGLDPAQQALLSHASRSGHIMMNVVEALLDMSDIRDGKLTFEPQPFALGELAGAIRERLLPLLGDDMDKVDIGLLGNAAARVTGDRRWIAQVAAQFMFHMIDTLRAEFCHCRIGCRETGIAIVISLGPESLLRWPPETMLFPETRATGGTAADASGPAVAREIVGLMQGAFDLERSGDGTVRLGIFVPAEAAAHSAVRIEAATGVMKHRLRQEIGRLGLPEWRQEMPNHLVGAVLIEPGPEIDARRIRTLRALHPGARLIAVAAAAGLDVDAVCAAPVCSATLRQALSGPGDAGAPAAKVA